MLEGLVATLLNRVLGMYVRNFDPKQLTIGIWNGEVKLRNLELKKEALDQLHLPLNVVEGHLGELTLSIPFRNLRGQPVKANIENVYLLAAPREDADYDQKEDERRAHAVKMEKLDSAELLKERNTEGLSNEEAQKQQSFAASLTTAIIDNLQVTVKNIHIRYEDSLSDPGHPFAAGITLQDFSAVSTDGNWQPTIIQGASDSTHKLAKLGALAIYWDTDTQLLGTGKGSENPDHSKSSHDEMFKKFQEMIVTAGDDAVKKHQFILKPVSGQAGIEIDKTGRTDRPKIKARLFFDELGFVLDEDQYRDALMLVDLFHYFIRHQEYKKLQPKASIKEDPRAWLAFAGTAVRDRIHDRNRRWSWDFFKERRDDRKRYIELFKKKKKDEKLTPSETTELDSLEKKLSYEDLRFWRSLARNQLKKEQIGVKKVAQKQTWSQWVWGGAQQKPDAGDDSQMTDEDREKLYSAIDWDEKKAIAESVDLPKDTVKMHVHMCLQTGSFTLRRDPHGKATNIIRLLFDSFNTSLTQRPHSILAKLSLQGMRLYDGATVDSLFPQIIKVKDTADDQAEADVGSLDQLMELSDQDLVERFEDQFFSLVFEQNPLDGSADSAIDMKLKAMEVVYNPRFIVETARFFKPPARHMESIGALMESASTTVEGIRKQTRAGLEFALEEHKTINAHFDLQAPLIIIPDSVTKKSTLCMILDAGHISVSSQLVDKETIREVQSKQRQQYSDEDFEKLENLLYDKFLLKLESTQLLLGPSIDATRAQLDRDDKDSNYHLIDRINMDFKIETCIVPKGTDLTRFRVSGTLPVLHASVSDSKYKKLMHLIDVAIPKFDEDSKEIAPPPRRQSSVDPVVKRERSKSFQFSAQEHDLIIEEDEEEFKRAKFHQAQAGDQTPGVSVNQRNFEFKFVVEKLRGSLYRSDPDEKKPDSLLAELIAQQFRLNFYQRPFDMVAEVSLRTLALEDHIEKDTQPEFRSIIASEESSSDSDLFSLAFRKVDPASPEFMPKYEGFGMNLDVAVSTLNVVVTRKTLLTLLDFVLVTFTNPDSEAPPEDKGSDTEKEIAQSSSGDRLRIRTELKQISLILNNDGIRLATLTLKTASVGLTLMGKTMRLGARLGDVTLVDDVDQGVAVESSLRQLITIQGDELADFTYETFDDQSDVYPGHDSSIHLRSGSIKINFVTEPFRKIVDFGVKFGKMQAIFNAARQAAANQATQISEKVPKMHFDILVRTPIVVFPRLVTTDEQAKRDVLTAYLGEIYASNRFVPIDDSKDATTSNEITAGIRNMRLTSLLHYSQDRSEELDLIDKVDLGFEVTYVDHVQGQKRPDLEVRALLSDSKLRVSSEQLKLALELSRSIPAAFAVEDEGAQRSVEKELPKSTTLAAKDVEPKPEAPSDKPTHLGPELGSDAEKWTKVDLVFKVGVVGLELLSSENNEPVGQLDKAGLSRFSINETNVKLRMLSDGSLESELLIQSFTITDTRQKETNKYRKVMSLVNTEISQQFMANVTISGGKDPHLLAILSVDSPRVILAIEYIFAIQRFLNVGLATDKPPEIEAEDETEPDTDSDDERAVSIRSQGQDKKEPESSMRVSFRVNVVDAQVILLANPSATNTEAIVLSMKQAMVAQQHATTLQVEKIGMFLCRMDRFDDSRLRILDDFSIATSMDVRSHGDDSSITNVHVDIEPLVLRLSLRDIRLVMQIIAKASELQSADSPPSTSEGQQPQRIKELKAGSSILAKRKTSTAARHAKTLKSRTEPSVPAGSTILKSEEMSGHIGGIRVVLIGNKHELPFLDWSVRGFDIAVRDWSGAMSADASIDTFLNVYTFSKSAWEPLIEPWTLVFHMSREGNPQKLTMDVATRTPLEVTVTAATIALMSKSFDFLSGEEDVLSKPRGLEAPYRMRNYTGFEMHVWSQNTDGGDGAAAKLSDGQEVPWRFEDPSTTRETLSPEGATGIVGMKLDDSGFDSIERIPINREGEVLYNLSPKHDNIQHRLLVEVNLGDDNIKYITFRSPLSVENATQIPIELGVFSPEEGHIHRLDPIPPGHSRPSPIGGPAYNHMVVIRPGQGFGYTWSNEKLFWKDLLLRPTQTIQCKGESDDAPPFYFQMHAVFNAENPLTKSYPYMKIRISAPVELQNLLPFDFKYKIYDKNTKKDWTNFLRKGGVSPIHVVNLSHLLLLSVDLQDTPFKQSDFAIINSPDTDFTRESALPVKDVKNLTLRLKLHYFNTPDTGGAFKISVYSPYVILNRTGLELDIKSKAFMASARAVAGQGILENDRSQAVPMMFSYNTEDPKNRSLIKVDDSDWSRPQSFEALGSTADVTLPSPTGKSEMHVGITVAQGEGKYNLTKVVTITPRFIIKSKIKEDIMIREPGSADMTTLKSNSLHPLRYVRQNSGQQLSVCFPGVNNQWSAPFYISNVGRVHVKIAKEKQRQQLVNIEILLEHATLFVHLSITDNWPFKIQNESDTEFLFWQANPNIEEDEDDPGNSSWRPIRYRVPPRSVMPYAWDFPASKNGDLLITPSNNIKPRVVKLAEIGQQTPWALPQTGEQSRQKKIDIEVVADGPRQTLVLANWRPSLSMYRQKTNATSQSTVGFEVRQQDSEVTMSAQLRLAGVGISLINQNLKELLYVTFRHIEIKYNESELYQTIVWTTKWIQIDNSLYGGIFPILLYPSVVPKTGKELESHPIFHLSLTRVKDESYGVLYVKYFTILLQQMTLEVDEDFIFSLLEFSNIPGASWSEEKEGKLCDESLDIPEPQSEEAGQDVYFELLHLQPMQIDLSFVRTERINAEDTMGSNNPFMFAVNVMTMSIGNVNDAPLRYNALLVENARTSVSALMAKIQSFYIDASLRQVHVILGSADFLGNPVGLFNTISSGVADIFYEPYQGLVMTDRPQDLGIGIAKGASSFVKKSVFGFSDSITKFTGSISKGLAAASMDKEFQAQRRMTRSRNRPKHALYGITAGGNAFANSLASGIGGLARHPMEGIEKEGAIGFVKGVGKGFLGLATKPALGAFDLASNLAEGVRNTTTVFDSDGLDRVRLTRFIGSDGIVRPYSQREALGQFWLKTLDNGKYFNENYIAHLELAGKDMIVVLTYNSIMLIRAKSLTTEWDVPLSSITRISKERTGMNITLREGRNGPFIPVADESSRNWLYRQIAISVQAFNSKYAAN